MVIAILRIVTLASIDFTGDYSYSQSYSAFWSVMEPGIGIIAACAITMRPLLDSALTRTGLLQSMRSLSSKRNRFASAEASTGGTKRRQYHDLRDEEGFGLTKLDTSGAAGRGNMLAHEFRRDVWEGGAGAAAVTSTSYAGGSAAGAQRSDSTKEGARTATAGVPRSFLSQDRATGEAHDAPSDTRQPPQQIVVQRDVTVEKNRASGSSGQW